MKYKCVLLYPDGYRDGSNIIKETLAQLAETLNFDVWDWNSPDHTHEPTITTIQKELSSADRVIAVLHSPSGELNPNIMYEVGFVHGANTQEPSAKLILVTRSDYVNSLPFNISQSQVANFPLGTDLTNPDWQSFIYKVTKWMDPNKLEKTNLILARCLDKITELTANAGTELVRDLEKIIKTYFGSIQEAIEAKPDVDFDALAQICFKFTEELQNDFSTISANLDDDCAKSAKNGIINLLARLREWAPLDDTLENGIDRFERTSSIKRKFVSWLGGTPTYKNCVVTTSMKKEAVGLFVRIANSDLDFDWQEINSQLLDAIDRICREETRLNYCRLGEKERRNSLGEWVEALKNQVAHAVREKNCAATAALRIQAITNGERTLFDYATTKHEIEGSQFLSKPVQDSLHSEIDRVMKRETKKWWKPKLAENTMHETERMRNLVRNIGFFEKNQFFSSANYGIAVCIALLIWCVLLFVLSKTGWLSFFHDQLAGISAKEPSLSFSRLGQPEQPINRIRRFFAAALALGMLAGYVRASKRHFLMRSTATLIGTAFICFLFTYSASKGNPANVRSFLTLLLWTIFLLRASPYKGLNSWQGCLILLMKITALSVLFFFALLVSHVGANYVEVLQNGQSYLASIYVEIGKTTVDALMCSLAFFLTLAGVNCVAQNPINVLPLQIPANALPRGG